MGVGVNTGVGVKAGVKVSVGSEVDVERGVTVGGGGEMALLPQAETMNTNMKNSDQ